MHLYEIQQDLVAIRMLIAEKLIGATKPWLFLLVAHTQEVTYKGTCAIMEAYRLTQLIDESSESV